MAGNPYLWSTTSATNSNADNDINWVEGQLPSTVNDSARGVMAGIAGWLKDTNGTLTTGGSANAQSVTSNVAYAALATGIRLVLKAGFTNTAACTLNLTPAGGGAFGAKAIKIITPTGETDAAICANGHYILEYDAAANAAAGAWILLNPAGAVAIQSFTASGTYTPRASMVYCIIECVGGGGGSGGALDTTGTNINFSGSGGGGEYALLRATAADIGASKTVTIGAGGAAGTNAPTAGSAGGDTSVGVLCVAKGGTGGSFTNDAVSGACGLGGTGGTGTLLVAGEAGNRGGGTGLGSLTTARSGGSGRGFGAGSPVTSFSAGGVAGIAGALYGGGGGPATAQGASRAGGAGADGLVLITEYSAA